MDSIPKMPGGAAGAIAKRVIGAVERERSRVAAMAESCHFGSERVEFQGVERSPIKRFLSSFVGGNQSGGWSAQATLQQGEIGEMVSEIKDAPYRPSKVEELRYSQTPEEKQYTYAVSEGFINGDGVGGVQQRNTVVRVNRETGALFIDFHEDTRGVAQSV